jgi:DNA polymerase I-like protein with 3'-5' exonuclease and polymerase domains
VSTVLALHNSHNASICEIKNKERVYFQEAERLDVGKHSKNWKILLNKLIQGSAADMTKKAMIELYKEGIIPHIQVHDELDISVKDKQQAETIKNVMEDAVSLEVPNKVDYESGPNWGTIKEK